MKRRPYPGQQPKETLSDRKRRELEEGLVRVKKKRVSYQRKIIGTALIFFILLIILCALLPPDNMAGYDGKWNKDVNSRQAKILQSLEENFK